MPLLLLPPVRAHEALYQRSLGALIVGDHALEGLVSPECLALYTAAHPPQWTFFWGPRSAHLRDRYEEAAAAHAQTDRAPHPKCGHADRFEVVDIGLAFDQIETHLAQGGVNLALLHEADPLEARLIEELAPLHPTEAPHIQTK